MSLTDIDGTYFAFALDTERIPSLVRELAVALKPYRKMFDSIAFRGMSGAILAPLLAVRMRKHLIMVRKPDSHHADNTVAEGYYKTKRYIILDDFISTGETCRAIIKAVDEWRFRNYVYAEKAKCVGGVFYRGRTYQKQNFYSILEKDAFYIPLKGD